MNVYVPTFCLGEADIHTLSVASAQELKSLAKQIELTYIANLRAPRPFQLCLTGLERGSRTHHTLTTHITGFHNYQAKQH